MPSLWLNMIAALAGLAIPGLGHAIKGHWRAGVKFQLMALGGVVLMCLSRLIVSPYGLEILAIFLAITHISSSLTAIKAPSLVGNQWRQHLIPCGFAMASLAMALGLFVGKASLLGVNVYYVPTASMVPAIMPGSLVLVDLRSYAHSLPQEGDIVTFTLPAQPERVLIKRIAEIETIRDGQHYYLIGDNPEQSFDSRHFGWIEQRHINGRITTSFSP